MPKYWFKQIIIFILFLVLTLGPASPILAAEYSFTNPLSSADPNEIIAALVKVALGVMGALALALFIYGGVYWMFSSGNEERAIKAKKIMVWTAVGMVIILGSYAILDIIFDKLITASQT